MNLAPRHALRVVGLMRLAPPRSVVKSMMFSSKQNDPDVDLSAEWIPPDRPLSGDKGMTHLYAKTVKKHKQQLQEIDLEEEVELDDDDDLAELEAALAIIEKPMTATVIPPPESDWLSTRRAKLRGLELMKPGEATAKRQAATDLVVIPGVLLTIEEIERCILTLGGLDLNLVLDGENKRMGGSLGMLFVTGTTTSHIKVMADTLVRQLKKRGLAKRNVVGAMFGSEACVDDDWIALDCMNYMVHFQLKETRKRWALEELWTGKDPLWKLNAMDDEAIDKYVYENPVPPEIQRTRGRRESSDVSETLAYLGRSRFNLPHRSVVDRPARKRGNRKPKKGRRVF